MKGRKGGRGENAELMGGVGKRTEPFAALRAGSFAALRAVRSGQA